MKGSRFVPAAIVLSVLLALSAGLSAAQGPAPEGTGPQASVGTAFTYQGQLQKGGALVNDTCTMVFSLYDDASAGSQRGDPITLTVSVADGLFTAVLNSGAEFGLTTFNGTALWLQVAVQCPGDAGFSTLAPRQALTAAPYALSLRPGAIVDGDTTGTVLSTRNRGEGDGLSGRSDSTHGRGVHGWATATSGDTRGVEGNSASTAGTGVYGLASAATGVTSGVYGESAATAGRGVYGEATATSGMTSGVYGLSSSTAGRGVFGLANATSGTTYGVYGLSASTAGAGVYGYANADSGTTIGLSGQVDSPGGTAVFGNATAGTGTNYGVWGQSGSTAGVGLSGYASATSGATYGVIGQVASSFGKGVYGYAGSTSPNGLAYGVYGEVAATGVGTYGYASAASGPAYGVVGRSMSSQGNGVRGLAGATTGPAYGVVGYTSSSEGAGVYGNSSSSVGVGVYGQVDIASGDNYGVLGTSASGGYYAAGVRGDAVSGSGDPLGVWGRCLSPDGCIGVWGVADTTTGNSTGVAGATSAPDGWGVWSTGDLGASGSKSAVVRTPDYGWRRLYSMESPEVLFEDVGTARLVDGAAVVPIDPVFAQTINLDKPYQVFLTPRGDCGLYVADAGAASFTVRALGGQACSIAFDYRLIAKRLGYEDIRLAPAHLPARILRELESISE